MFFSKGTESKSYTFHLLSMFAGIWTHDLAQCSANWATRTLHSDWEFKVKTIQNVIKNGNVFSNTWSSLDKRKLCCLFSLVHLSICNDKIKFLTDTFTVESEHWSFRRVICIDPRVKQDSTRWPHEKETQKIKTHAVHLKSLEVLKQISEGWEFFGNLQFQPKPNYTNASGVPQGPGSWGHFLLLKHQLYSRQCSITRMTLANHRL